MRQLCQIDLRLEEKNEEIEYSQISTCRIHFIDDNNDNYIKDELKNEFKNELKNELKDD